MNRRDFLAGIARTGSLLGAPSARDASADHDSLTGRGTLAGLTLEQLRDEYHRYLFDDFLPFMDKYVIDHEYGGFMCDTDYDGTRADENKFDWYEGRGIWVYSFLYKHLAPDAKYLQVARRSLEFILKNEPDDDTLWARQFTREGKPLTGPDHEIYGDLFIAEGLTAYAAATGNPTHLDHAYRLVEKCWRIYDRPDYDPLIGRTYLGPTAPDFPGARIQGAWMVFLRLAAQMLVQRPDPEVEEIADRCVEALIEYHYNPEFQLNNELINHDLSRPQNEYRQLAYPGHTVEVSWMLLDEAVRKKNRTLFETAAARFRRHVDVAWDRVYDGLFYNLKNVDQNIWMTDKLLVGAGRSAHHLSPHR